MTSKNFEILEIYQKEREYQRRMFGEYSELRSLNFASFLVFIEKYLQKAKAAYCDQWLPKEKFPRWLKDCEELKNGTAPVKAYEEVIKIMALAGALLETYTDLVPKHWRREEEWI